MYNRSGNSIGHTFIKNGAIPYREWHHKYEGTECDLLPAEMSLVNEAEANGGEFAVVAGVHPGVAGLAGIYIGDSGSEVWAQQPEAVRAGGVVIYTYAYIRAEQCGCVISAEVVSALVGGGCEDREINSGCGIDAPALLGIAEIEQVYGYSEVTLAKQFGGIRIGAGSIVINAVTVAIAAKAKLDTKVLVEHLGGKYTDAAIGAAAGAVVGIIIAHGARTEAEANAKIPAMHLAIACRFLLIIAAGLIAIAGVAAAAAAGEGAGCCAIGIGEGGFGAVGIDYRYYTGLHDGNGGAVLVVKVFVGDLGGVYLQHLGLDGVAIGKGNHILCM